MSMFFCRYCRAYTPAPVNGRCPICGMAVSDGEPLAERTKQIRPYVESSIEPIRVKLTKGKTMKFHDFRQSKTYYTSIESDAEEKEYMIMDARTLSDVLGIDIPPENTKGKGKGKISGRDFTVRYTSDEDALASLNQKPIPREYSWCAYCHEYVPSGIECIQCGRPIPGNTHGLRFGVKWKGFMGDKKEFSVYDGEVSRVFEDVREPSNDYYVSISRNPNEIPEFYILDLEGIRFTLADEPQYSEDEIVEKNVRDGNARFGRCCVRYTTNPDLVGSLNKKPKGKKRKC